MLELEFLNKREVIAADQSTRDILKKSFFGYEEEGKLHLLPEEVLYLVDIRNAKCRYKGKSLSFDEVAEIFSKKKKLMASYFAYKDWRERGLVISPSNTDYKKPGITPIRKYPSSSIDLPKWEANGIFFSDDLITIIKEPEKGKELYEKFWIGQYGSYKAPEKGKLNKLDIYETLYLMERKRLSIKSMEPKDIIKIAKKRRKDFPMLYEVYKDWRENGYIVKTGFKFGTHFRVYFPGAKPGSNSSKEEWAHSKHVLHVFPRDSKLLISEWARAIRVAHSVRKTFILAIPGEVKEKEVNIEYILYHRHGGEADNPEKDQPRYAMLSLGEEEQIGGRELAGAISKAKEMKLELLIAIADRETAITYYKVKQILLPKSGHEYYEIDWMQP
ncbi:MAG: tRNA-intron lyase [Candidatus Micrarchaeia archaeon]|jgi:tRNA-intron endonuclease